MVRILLLLLALTAAATPARADMTATYRHPRMAVTITVQVADNGDARMQFSTQPWWMQIVGGEAYAVYPRPGGSARVVRFADIERLFAERTPPVPSAPTLERSSLVRQGEASVAGYRGTAYFLTLPQIGGLSPYPVLVVSRDPTLAALSRPIIMQMDLSIATYRIAGTRIPPVFVAVRDTIGDGAPIIFMGCELQPIDRRPIDPALLRLPAPPVTLEELRHGGVPNIS